MYLVIISSNIQSEQFPDMKTRWPNIQLLLHGKLKNPTASQRKYKVDIVNRPFIRDNSKYWQVFEDDMQIKIFLELSSEFVNTLVDNKNDNLENIQDAEDSE